MSDTFDITVANVNDAPINLALSNSSVVENSAGATVGTLARQMFHGDSLTYSLASGGDNDFLKYPVQL